MNKVSEFAKSVWGKVTAYGEDVAAALAFAVVAAIALGSNAFAQAEGVSVDSMGIDISETATNFGTQLGIIILAVLGITMGLAVIRFFARWLGAKKAS